MNDTAVRCQNPGCKNEIGTLHPLAEGISLLDLGGGLLVSHCRGVCKQCGATFHFDINDQKLARLIERIVSTGDITATKDDAH